MKPTLADSIWGLIYFAVMATVISGLVKVRSNVLAAYDAPSAQTDWDEWRAEAKQMETGKGPVKRREPKSAEPPALVLMRDHFAVCLGGAIVLSSVLFGTFMVFIRGALANPSLRVSSSPRVSPSPPAPLPQGERGEEARLPTPDPRPPA